jgi:hypothetical protein
MYNQYAKERVNQKNKAKLHFVHKKHILSVKRGIDLKIH